MPNKKITEEEIQEEQGPMNDVAKEDAMVYANADPNRPLDKKRKRIVVAKKQQIKNASKKHDRRINKNLKKFTDDLPKEQFTKQDRYDIIIEDADAGSTMAGNVASVAFPLFGKKKMVRRAVDPKGYLGDGKLKKQSTGYNTEVKLK